MDTIQSLCIYYVVVLVVKNPPVNAGDLRDKQLIFVLIYIYIYIYIYVYVYVYVYVYTHTHTHGASLMAQW